MIVDELSIGYNIHSSEKHMDFNDENHINFLAICFVVSFFFLFLLSKSEQIKHQRVFELSRIIFYEIQTLRCFHFLQPQSPFLDQNMVDTNNDHPI